MQTITEKEYPLIWNGVITAYEVYQPDAEVPESVQVENEHDLRNIEERLIALREEAIAHPDLASDNLIEHPNYAQAKSLFNEIADKIQQK